MAEHARFSPSSLHRLSKCPASLMEAESRPPQEATEFAARGTLLHEYVVRARKKGPTVIQELKDREDRYHILACLEYIDKLVLTCKKMHSVELEKKVSLENFGLPQIWGTADVVMLDYYARKVHVVDWKFGKGIQVFAQNNQQGLAYLAGAAAEYQNFHDFTFHIVQPTKKHVDSFNITREDLEKHVEYVFKATVVKCLDKNPKYFPSNEACQWCPAKVDCVARKEHNESIAKKIFFAKAKLPRVPKEELAEILSMEKDIKAYLKDIKDYAFGQLKNNKGFPNFKLVKGRVSRTYINESEAYDWFKENTDIPTDELYTTKFKTPASIEADYDYLKKDEEFQKLIYRKEGKLDIVPESHKKPAWKPEHAALNVFSKYINKEK